MLMVKNKTVIDCLQLSDTETRDDEKLRHFRKAAFLFSKWIGLFKTSQDIHGKINVIWWNIKINLEKLWTCVHVHMWTWITNKSAKFHAKRLNWSKNIRKSFRAGATFFETQCIGRQWDHNCLVFEQIVF